MKKRTLAGCLLSIVCVIASVQPALAAAPTTTPELTVLPEQSAQKSDVVAPASPDSSTLGTIQDDPDGSTFPPRRAVIVSAFSTIGGLDYIQMYNDNTDSKPPVDLTGWRLVVDYNNTSQCTIELNHAMFSKTYALFAQTTSTLAGEAAETYTCPADAAASVNQLRVYDHETLVERIYIPDTLKDLQWQRTKVTESGRTGVFENDFVSKNQVDLGENSPLYITPARPHIAITELLVNPRDCLPGDTDKSCYDYVKLKNTGNTAIDLSSYRLRTGYKNTDARATNTIYLYGVLPAGATVRIDQNADGSPVSISANDGTAWIEDVYGLATYDLHVPPYVGSDKAAHRGQSWAYDAARDQWRWAVPSPLSVENNFNLPPPPQKKTSTTPQYKPCAADQYRSPTTHRCRSLASTTSTLKPCAPNQTRNPLTNRCRSVLGASTSLKPCAPNQERNPDTNRCRKIQTTAASTDFAVEPLKQGVKGFAGWWAIGGLTALAAGYATWEWRDEIRRTTARATQYFRSGK